MFGIDDIIGVAAPILGGLIGGSQSSGARGAQEDQIKAGMAALAAVPLPDIEKMKLVLQKIQDTGGYNPLLEQAIQQGDTSLAQVQLDQPTLGAGKQALNEALSRMASGGMTAMDKAQLEDILKQSSQAAQAQQKAILEDRARRGQASSGDALAAALSGSQAASNQASEQAMRLAAQAMQNRLANEQNVFGMSQALTSADYQRQAEMARQRDAIAQFNAAQQAAVQQRNIGSQTQAAQARAGQLQDLAARNAAIANEQQMRNAQLYQKQFENQMEKATGMAGAHGALARQYGDEASRTAGMWGDIAKGVGGIASGLLGNKKDISPGSGAGSGTNYLGVNTDLSSLYK